MYNVIIFGYDFPHKKSEDFLHILKKHDIHVVAYLAAKKVDLKLPKKIYLKNINNPPIFHPKELCEIYNIPYYQVEHNSNETIEIINSVNGNIGIISGARILKDCIINNFKYGIINFHPGKIPEASGLDGLFWSIYKNVPLFMTTHFIDKRIDAGLLIKECKVDFYKDDRIEDIKHKIHLTENKELITLCQEFLKVNKEITCHNISNYNKANIPMDEIMQENVLTQFLSSWLIKYGKDL